MKHMSSMVLLMNTEGTICLIMVVMVVVRAQRPTTLIVIIDLSFFIIQDIKSMQTPRREITLEIVPYFRFEGQGSYERVVHDVIKNVFISYAWDTVVSHTITPYFSRRAPGPPTLWLLLLTPGSQNKAKWSVQQKKLLEEVAKRQANAHIMFLIPRLDIDDQWTDVPDKDDLMPTPPYVVIDIKQTRRKGKSVSFNAGGNHSQNALKKIREKLKEIVPDLPNIVQLDGDIRVIDLSPAPQEAWWTTNTAVGIGILAIILGIVLMAIFIPRGRRRRRR